MVTVSSPSSSPVPVYNREGTTIANLTANGYTQSGAAVIVAPSGWTVVTVAISGTVPTVDVAAKLPSAPLIGDLVEVYISGVVSGQPAYIFPASGMAIGALGTNNPISMTEAGGGFLFRYITANKWQVLGGL